MSDVPSAVITGFITAFTMFLAVVAFTGRQIRDLKVDLKGDIAGLRSELKGDIGNLRSELKSDIDNLRSELKGDIGNLRSELKSDIDNLRSEVRSDIRRLDEKFDQMMFELLRHVREGGHQPPPQAA